MVHCKVVMISLIRHYKQPRTPADLRGFTIVELLIVIVVIAILATITIVGYNGIAQHAKESAATSAVTSAKSKLALYSAEKNGEFPASLSDVGVANSDTTQYQYSVNNTSNPPGYCLTVTVSSVAAYTCDQYSYTLGGNTQVANQSAPSLGASPVHSASGAPIITNLAKNPSVETAVSSFGSANGASYAPATDKAYVGDRSLLVTMASGYTMSNTGVRFLQDNSYMAMGFEPSTKYTVTVWVWIPSNSIPVGIHVQGSGRASIDNPVGWETTTKGQWVRLRNTFTTTASDGTLTFYVLNRATTSTTNQFYMDGIMVVKGDNSYNFADGNSDGWNWSGSANVSSSYGPAL